MVEFNVQEFKTYFGFNHQYTLSQIGEAILEKNSCERFINQSETTTKLPPM